MKMDAIKSPDKVGTYQANIKLQPSFQMTDAGFSAFVTQLGMYYTTIATITLPPSRG